MTADEEMIDPVTCENCGETFEFEDTNRTEDDYRICHECWAALYAAVEATR